MNEGTFSDEILYFVSENIRNIFGKETQDMKNKLRFLVLSL